MITGRPGGGDRGGAADVQAAGAPAGRRTAAGLLSAPAMHYGVAHLRAGAAALPGHAAALSVVDNRSCHHAALPSDLFALIAFCDESLSCVPAGNPASAAAPPPRLRLTLAALRTRQVQVHTQGSGQSAIAMLTPLGLLRAFGLPLQGATDRRFELRDLIPAAEEAQLHAALVDAQGAAARSAALGRWLEQRTAARRHVGAAGERVAQVAMAMLGGSSDGIDELARQQRISRSRLERDFREWLGVAPRAYSRLVRFQRAAAAVAAGLPLVRVAAEQGFADQAHMTRSFREIAGVTPSDVRAPGAAGQKLQAATAGRVVFVPTPIIALPVGADGMDVGSTSGVGATWPSPLSMQHKGRADRPPVHRQAA